MLLQRYNSEIFFEKYLCKDTLEEYFSLGNTFAEKHLRNTFAKIHFSNIFFEKYLLARQMPRLEVSMAPTEKVPPNSKQQPGDGDGDGINDEDDDDYLDGGKMIANSN